MGSELRKRFWSSFCTALLVTVVASNALCQTPDKDFYLIYNPDLNYANLAEIDSVLRIYHDCQTDTCRINALSELMQIAGELDIVPYSKLTIAKADTFLKNAKTPELQNYGRLKLAESHYYLGITYYMKGQPYASATQFLESLKYYKALKDEDNTSTIFNNLGLINADQGDTATAFKYYKQALVYFEKTNDHKNIAMTENNIGLNYVNHGQMDRAMRHFNKAISELRLDSNMFSLATITHNIGGAFSMNHMDDSALVYYEKALHIRRQINDKKGQAFSLKNIAGILECRGQIDLAEQKALESLEIAETYNYIRNRRNVYELLASINRKKGNYKMADAYFQSYITLRDSLKNEETQRQTLKQSLQYEYENRMYLDSLQSVETIKLHDLEKDKVVKLAKAKQDQLVIIIIAISIVTALVIALIMITYQRLQTSRKQHQIIEKQANQLRELDFSKTRFFNNVAHELRTPLTLLTGHMESLLNGRYGALNENQHKSVTIAHRNGERMIDLISEILSLGKIESTSVELETKPVLLKSFLNRTFFTFESLAHQFEITMTFNYLMNEDTVLEIDENKMEKVLNNLLHNALKFTPRKGSVSLNAVQKGAFIQLIIKDSGVGIRKKDQEQVFERYFQSSLPGEMVQGGTGIGLTIVKEYVQLHGGEVHLKSEPEKGSEFIINLPASLISDKAPNESTDEMYASDKFPDYPIIHAQKSSVLVVDDHAEMQEYIKSILNPYARVYLAFDGIEALEMLEKHKIDLITVDLMMPNMDGFEFLKKLKLSGQLRSIPTIMITARTTEEDKLEGYNIGINDYITKPFNQLELIARVANLLENKHQIELENKTEGINQHKDDQFLTQLNALVTDNLSNPEFTIADISDAIGLGEKQLTRKVKTITGLTPLKFIRERKLLKAQELLKTKTYETMAEVSYAVGFETPGYFADLYYKRFGKKPSSYYK